MKKFFIFILALLALTACSGGDSSTDSSSDSAASSEETTNEELANDSISSAIDSSETSEEVSEPTTETPVEKGNTVIYTNQGYSPNSLTVAEGTTVTFQNESSKAMWTASANHPTHGVYPTEGGCLGSTFDACKGIQPGDSWSFTFDEVGEWGYHDHLDPSKFGEIVVK